MQAFHKNGDTLTNPAFRYTLCGQLISISHIRLSQLYIAYLLLFDRPII